MFLRSWPVESLGQRFPHAGGDVSGDFTVDALRLGFSPRRWGCFRPRLSHGYPCPVFPTQVGMFPTDDARLNAEHRFSPRRWGCFSNLFDPVAVRASFPHAGGDVSEIQTQRPWASEFSPRRWGCFYLAPSGTGLRHVFPTQVGMFLTNRTARFSPSRFPHAGGDVSITGSTSWDVNGFSPRRWGCF